MNLYILIQNKFGGVVVVFDYKVQFYVGVEYGSDIGYIVQLQDCVREVGEFFFRYFIERVKYDVQFITFQVISQLGF